MFSSRTCLVVTAVERTDTEHLYQQENYIERYFSKTWKSSDIENLRVFYPIN